MIDIVPLYIGVRCGLAYHDGRSQVSIPKYAPIWPILQKGCTMVEWTRWRHRNANDKDVFQYVIKIHFQNFNEL